MKKIKIITLPRKELGGVKGGIDAGGAVVAICKCTAICKTTPSTSTLSKAACKKNSWAFL